LIYNIFLDLQYSFTVFSTVIFIVMSNTIATVVITGGWTAVGETLQVTKASVSSMGKLHYYSHIA